MRGYGGGARDLDHESLGWCFCHAMELWGWWMRMRGHGGDARGFDHARMGWCSCRARGFEYDLLRWCSYCGSELGVPTFGVDKVIRGDASENVSENVS